jgi:DNA-binding transcriptional LysR family regulator
MRMAAGKPELPNWQTGSASLSLTRLRYFVAVAEELHFGRAAARLGLSQPPLTKQIQALEAQCGAPLFVRNRRKVTLTPVGRVLLDEARRLLDHAARVSHAIHGAGTGESGSLYLGCVPFALFHALPAIARQFRAANPNINLILGEDHTAEILKGVADGRLDFGLAWANRETPELDDLAVLSGRFVAALPEGHRLLARRKVSIAALGAEPLILPARHISPYHYSQFVAAFAAEGITPRIEYEVPTILSQLGYAASGFGVALVPEFARRFTGMGIAFRPISNPTPPVKLSLVWRRDRLSQAGHRFIAAVRAARSTKD